MWHPWGGRTAPTPSAIKSMFISGCGTLAVGGGGGWDPDYPSAIEEALLVIRGTRWGALSSGGKRMASKDTILSIAVGSLQVVYKDREGGGETGKVGEERLKLRVVYYKGWVEDV